MEPETIRVLLAATPNKLEKVAKKAALPLPIARDIRVQAMNLVLGKCVLCGKYTLTGMCSRCKRDGAHRRMIPWSSIKLLKLMRPSDQLLRRTCKRCNGEFMLSAGYLLWKLLAKHSDELKDTCNSCVRKAEEEARRAELQKREEERRRKAAEHRNRLAETRKRKAESKPRSQNGRHDHFYKPFAGHEALEKLRKELKKAHPRRKARKEAQKG